MRAHARTKITSIMQKLTQNCDLPTISFILINMLYTALGKQVLLLFSRMYSAPSAAAQQKCTGDKFNSKTSNQISVH
jgi:hypothetical protein